MDDAGEMREDVKMPEDDKLHTEIQEKFDKGDPFMVTVLKSMDDEAVVAVKTMKQ